MALSSFVEIQTQHHSWNIKGTRNMGRHSTVATHPQRARVDSMLADGISYRTIAREMRLSPSSVARYASGRKSDLARIADHETSTADVLSRLAAAADHATELRQQSRMGSTPSQQSRAIATEVQILTKILDELGIDDLAIGEYTAAVEALISGIQRFTRGHPGSADDLIKTLAADPATIDLATALKRQIESSN